MMKKIMKRAWQIYRALVGDRIAKLSMALRQAWAEAKAVSKKQYSMNELSALSKMRAGAREKAFAADPELRAAYEEYAAHRTASKAAAPVAKADENGCFTFHCSECGNTFKAFGKYAKCRFCGEDTYGMVHAA